FRPPDIPLQRLARLSLQRRLPPIVSDSAVSMRMRRSLNNRSISTKISSTSSTLVRRHNRFGTRRRPRGIIVVLHRDTIAAEQSCSFLIKEGGGWERHFFFGYEEYLSSSLSPMGDDRPFSRGSTINKGGVAWPQFLKSSESCLVALCCSVCP